MLTNIQKNKKQEVLTEASGLYSKGLSLYAIFKTSDKEKSKDLVQDTFLKTWKYIVKGGKIVIMRAFLYHILNDLIIDEYRKNKSTSLDDLIDKGFEPSFDESVQLSDNFDSKIILPLIDQLPDKYQKVIRMRFIDDLSLEEISKILKKSKNSVSVQINRGLRRLKILYKIYK